MIFVALVVSAGCALESPPEVSGSDEVSAGGAIAEDDTAPEDATISQASTSAAAASCAVVVSCNAPGPDGTRCRQQGCSAGAAELACALGSVVVCGTPVCPVILIRSDGTRDNLCHGGRL